MSMGDKKKLEGSSQTVTLSLTHSPTTPLLSLSPSISLLLLPSSLLSLSLTSHSSWESSPVGKNEQWQIFSIHVLDSLSRLEGGVRIPHLTCLTDQLHKINKEHNIIKTSTTVIFSSYSISAWPIMQTGSRLVDIAKIFYGEDCIFLQFCITKLYNYGKCGKGFTILHLICRKMIFSAKLITLRFVVRCTCTYCTLSVWICRISRMCVLHRARFRGDDTTGDSP